MGAWDIDSLLRSCSLLLVVRALEADEPRHRRVARPMWLPHLDFGVRFAHVEKGCFLGIRSDEGIEAVEPLVDLFLV